MCTDLLKIKLEQKSLMLCGIAYPVWVLLVVVTEASIPFERCQLSWLVGVKRLQSRIYNAQILLIACVLHAVP